MGIVDDIVDGTATWEQVYAHIVEVAGEMLDRERNNKHPADTCGKKYCKHGNKRVIKQQEQHLDELKRELQLVRAGVTPTSVR